MGFKKNIVFILVVSILFISCSKDNQAKIGVLFPMTGDAGQYGVDGKKAIDLAVEQVNKDGGVNMKPIKVFFEDSKADARVGTSAMEKLVSVNKVDAVVGDIVSSVTIPASVIAEKNKTILIAPTSSAPAITNAGQFIYRVWPSDFFEGEAAGKYAKKKGFKKAVILHLNNDYGTQIGEIFTKTFSSTIQKVILNEAYDPKQKDFKTLLTKVKDNNPDVIYIAGYYEDTGELIKQSKRLGINASFIGATAIEDNKFIQLAGSATEGIVYPLASGFDPNSLDSSTKKFVDDFKKKYHYTPSWVESHCYDAFMLIITAMKKTGKTDGESIKKYFDTMGVYNGVTGSIRFDSNGDIIKPVVYKTVRNGKFEKLENY